MQKYDLIQTLKNPNNEDDYTEEDKKYDAGVIIYLLNSIIWDLMFNLKPRTEELLQDYSIVPDELNNKYEKKVATSEKVFNTLKNVKFLGIALYLVFIFINKDALTMKTIGGGAGLTILAGFVLPHITMRIYMSNVSKQLSDIMDEISNIRQPYLREKSQELFDNHEKHLLEIYTFIIQYSSKNKLMRGYIPDEYIRFKDLFLELDKSNISMSIFYLNNLFNTLFINENNDREYNELLNDFDENIKAKVIEDRLNNKTEDTLFKIEEELKNYSEILNEQRSSLFKELKNKED